MYYHEYHIYTPNPQGHRYQKLSRERFLCCSESVPFEMTPLPPDTKRRRTFRIAFFDLSIHNITADSQRCGGVVVDQARYTSILQDFTVKFTIRA